MDHTEASRRLDSRLYRQHLKPLDHVCQRQNFLFYFSPQPLLLVWPETVSTIYTRGKQGSTEKKSLDLGLELWDDGV